jgi:hypothetical protein
MNGRWGQALVLPGGLSQSYLKASWMVAHMGSGYQALGIHRLFLMSGYHGNVKLLRSMMPSMASTTHPSFDRGAGRVSRPALPLSLLPVQPPTSI